MNSTQKANCSAARASTKATIDAAVKKIADRKRVLEQSRATTVRRFGGELGKIARSEIDFAKSLIDEMVPIKIIFDEERLQSSVSRLWTEFAEQLPVRVEFKEGMDFLHHGMKTTGPDSDSADAIEPMVDAAENVDKPIA